MSLNVGMSTGIPSLFLDYGTKICDFRINMQILNKVIFKGDSTKMHNRLKDIRLALKLGQKEFCDFVGITQPNLSKIENGKQKLTPDEIERVCDIPNLNILYFVKGIGPMFLRELNSDLIEEAEVVYETNNLHDIRTLVKVVLELKKEVEEIKAELREAKKKNYGKGK